MGRLRIAALGLLLLTGCAELPGDSENPRGLVFLTREGCANTARMRANLDDALAAMGLGADYAVIDLMTLPATDVRRGYPTPTVLYANRDLFGLPTPIPPLPEPA